MIPVERLEGEVRLAGHLDVGHDLVLVLVQAREHLGGAAVGGEVTLADLNRNT